MYFDRWNGSVPFEVLTGCTIKSVRGLERHSDDVYFETSDGIYKMYHEQDCCESVYVESITGDVDDLIDAVVIEARVDRPDDPALGEYAESWTWTFYSIQTNKGFVQIRWYGSSNGYYGEGVSFVKGSEVN